VGRSLRGVLSMRVFYSANRGDRILSYPCEPNF
jgi:hypothetical protein